MKTAAGMVILAFFLVGVNLLATLITTYVPWLTMILLGATFSYLTVVVYQGLRDS
jgi:LytS/YehU family sensor histidine kinase